MTDVRQDERNDCDTLRCILKFLNNSIQSLTKTENNTILNVFLWCLCCYPFVGMPTSWPFPFRKTDPLHDPCPWFPLGSPTLNFGSPPPPRPVTRQGVRGLIICTDPGLSPRGGCLGTVALDPIDTVRGRRRGEENRPWLQSVGPPRQVDECPGLHDLCHPSQWSQATMSYSL